MECLGRRLAATTLTSELLHDPGTSQTAHVTTAAACRLAWCSETFRHRKIATSICGRAFSLFRMLKNEFKTFPMLGSDGSRSQLAGSAASRPTAAAGFCLVARRLALLVLTRVTGNDH